MYAFVSDFDGTITDDDFFTLISDKYFSYEMLAPWREYISGNKTHFNALNEMFAQIHLPESEFKKFIKNIRLDKSFFKVCKLCKQKNIPIYICSAGCEYYIRELIGAEIKKYDITLISNFGAYSQEKGLTMTAPETKSPFFDEKIGISKQNLVKKLKKDGFSTIFAGDGPPDFEPAKVADIVFAKKILLQRCRENAVPVRKFNTFEDVYQVIEEL